jgi:DNA primase
MIDKPTIDKIFNAADILEVIGEFVSLKRSGQNYKGLSPFTNEKTPSFFVNPSKGIFKCFSSGVGGNAVSFLMEHEKLSYPEALKYLAKKYNIPVEEKEQSADEIKEQNERESLLAALTFAQKQFSEWLWNREEGKAIGMSYYTERGFHEKTIKTFQLGYSLNQRDAFTKLASEKGYKIDYLVKSGLSIEKGSYRFDRFSGRVIFPIHSLSGQVVGFGGRILKKDDKLAKYVNSPESEVYHKSQVLYGLYFAKSQIIKADKCYLVEGYTDVISMHQSGIENVVASSGTALTPEQIRLIKRFTKNVTIIYDGDEAGIKASLRGIDLILEEGMNVKVLLLPEGEDPDSFARSHSASGLLKYITSNEADFIRFKTKLLVKQSSNDPVQRATLISDVVRSISVIPDSIIRSVYIKECSKLLDINENMLYTETYKIRRDKFQRQQKSKDYRKTQDNNQSQPSQHDAITILEDYGLEKNIARILIQYGNQSFTLDDKPYDVAQYILNELDADDLELQHPVYKKIVDEARTLCAEQKAVTVSHFASHPDVDINRTTADLLASGYMLSEIWRKNEIRFETEDMKLKVVIPGLVLAFKHKKIMALLRETQKSLAEITAQTEQEEVILLQQKVMVLNELKKNISKKLGDRIIL